jgi:hypothetical protein|tara:strand:- start:2 stop:562 length:561 start_codon:yes stop_codon:yes gene_type:complete
MNYFIVIILLVLVIYLTTSRESFTEAFGLSGYTKPIGVVKLDDPRPDLSKYTEVEVSIDNDNMEEFVLQANKEISKRTGLCTYIIETTAVRHYKGDDKDIYECMFMTVKKDGFAFGFSVVASYEVEKSGKVTLISLRSQPLGVQVPSDVKAFSDGSPGKEFLDYKIVKEVAVPTKAELDSVKNKLQ